MSLALLEAVRSDKLRQGADVVALYNGIEVGQDKPEPIDSLSVIHLGEHLERLSAQDLRKLDTQVPLETLRAVVDLALEIGREGARGPSGRHHVRRRRHAQGADDVAADELQSVPRLQRRRARHPRPSRPRADQGHRPDWKAPSSSAATAWPWRPCMRIDAPDKGITLSKGLGTRHAAAAAISKAPRPSPSPSASRPARVRLFQNGEVMLHIEPLHGR